MTAAFILMLVLAVLRLAGMFVDLADVGSMRESIHSILMEVEVGGSADQNVAIVNAILIGWLVLGVLITVLWTWLAFACRAGKGWARTTVLVVFALMAIRTVSALRPGPGEEAFNVSLDLVTRLATLGLFLVVVILLCRVHEYFSSARPINPPV